MVARTLPGDEQAPDIVGPTGEEMPEARHDGLDGAVLPIRRPLVDSQPSAPSPDSDHQTPPPPHLRVE